MLECLILGDSIAVGTQAVAKQCESYAVGGLNSWQWNKRFLDKDLSANTVIISLGSNDHKYIKTKKELETLRNKVHAQHVVWILPAGNLRGNEVNIEDIRTIVSEIAKEHGDRVVPIRGLSKDGIHPTGKGYQAIAQESLTKN